MKDVISEKDFKILLETAKSIFYPKRTYNRVLNTHSGPSSKKELLKTF